MITMKNYVPSTVYDLHQEVFPNGTIVYKIKSKLELSHDSYPFHMAGVSDKWTHTYPVIKLLSLKLPLIIKKRSVGQYVNPTKLLKEHWEAYYAQEGIRHPHEEADSFAETELSESLSIMGS